MPVRPESYKIVMILFYLLLCTKYLFEQNLAKEKIFAIAVEIKVACYQAQKKYRLHKNIGFDCCLNCKSDKLRLSFIKECVENNYNLSVMCREYASQT